MCGGNLKTHRGLIPVQAPDTENQKPFAWVQTYTGDWQEIPEVNKKAWASYSNDRYSIRVIGVESRDGKYLSAMANDTATVNAQAWHDCIHNNAHWQPAKAHPSERRWRVKVYGMENDPQKLLARVKTDFPNADKPGS